MNPDQQNNQASNQSGQYPGYGQQQAGSAQAYQQQGMTPEQIAQAQAQYAAYQQQVAASYEYQQGQYQQPAQVQPTDYYANYSAPQQYQAQQPQSSSMYPSYYGDSSSYADILTATQTGTDKTPGHLIMELIIIAVVGLTFIGAGFGVYRILRATALNPATVKAADLVDAESSDFTFEIPKNWKKVSDPEFTTAFADNVSLKKRYAVFGGFTKDYGTSVDFDALSEQELKAQLDDVVDSINEAKGTDVGVNCGEGSTASAEIGQHVNFTGVVSLVLHCLDDVAKDDTTRDKEVRGYIAFKASKSYQFVIQADTTVWKKNESVFTRILDGVAAK